MRFKEDILRDINYGTTLDAQLRLNNELLLDLRSVLLSIAPDDFFNKKSVDEKLPPPPKPAPEPAPEPDIERDPNDISLADIPMSMRTFNVLWNEKYRYLSDLKGKTAGDFLKYRNFGQICLTELRAVLAEYDMTIPAR